MLSISLLAGSSPLQAQVVAEDQQSSTKLDIMILMDSSGSMLVNDPQRLRDKGVELFVEKLSSEDRVGLVRFAEDAKLVLPLNTSSTSLAKVLQAELAKIESMGTYTNIYSGIEVAAKQLLSSVRDDATPVLVLLSDGKMEPPPQFGEPKALTKKLVDDLLPDLRAKNIRIYTLSFSNQADRELLSQIAKSTDAASWFTPSVEKLKESFEDLLLVLNKVTAKGSNSIKSPSKGLLVEHDVEEVTFYLARNATQSLTLISPAGDRYSNDARPDSVRWHKGDDFDIVSVKAPAVGTWSIEGYGTEEGFATVLPELGVDITIPDLVRVDSPVEIGVSLFNADKPIALAKMLDLITFEFEVIPTDKVSEAVIKGTLLPKIEVGSFPDDVGAKQTIRLGQAGQYALLLKAIGPTFQKEQKTTFYVKPSLITLRGIEDPHITKMNEGQDLEEHGSLITKNDEVDLLARVSGFEISLHPEVMKYKDLSVNVIIIDSRGNRRELGVDKVPEDRRKYRLKLDALVEDGEYTAVALLRAVTSKGDAIESESSPVEFRFNSSPITSTDIRDMANLPTSEAHKGEAGGQESQASGEMLQSSYSIPLLILSISIADLIGLLIVLKVMGIRFFRREKVSEEVESLKGINVSEEAPVSTQSDLDELKAFAQRVEEKVLSKDFDPLDSAYDEMVMRMEERLAAEDFKELSLNSGDNPESQIENLK